MKKLRLCLGLCLLLLPLAACFAQDQKYQTVDYTLFDTQTTITAYTASEEEFARFSGLVLAELTRLHRLFDIYHDYEGINNLKTLNDAAGWMPVPLDADVLDMLALCQEAYEASGGMVDVSLGKVYAQWREAREQAQDGSAALPSLEALRSAADQASMSHLVLDRDGGTAFISDGGTALDVGAIAKGYAAQKAAELARAEGFDSFLLDMGGNIVTSGAPAGRAHWTVGIQDPFGEQSGVTALYDTLHVKDMCVVTSGVYQRYFTLGDTRYHHLIDPTTLQPGNRYEAVSILHPDSGIGDMLSTALFLLPVEDGRALLDTYGGSAIWIYADGTSETAGDYETYRMAS